MRSFLTEAKAQKGASAVEYVVLLTLITLVIIVSVSFLGDNTRNAFETVSPAFSDGSVQQDKCGDKDSDDDKDCGKGND